MASAEFDYEVEIVGGIIVANTAIARNGYLEVFFMPDGTSVATNHDGMKFVPPRHADKLRPIAELVEREIERMYADEIAETATPVRPDTAPIYL